MRLIGAALLACLALPVSAESIVDARFLEPTSRYAHGVLGDAIEWGVLEIVTKPFDQQLGATDAVLGQTQWTYRLPLDHVFEDVAPRLADVTGDGIPEVVVVETDVAQGAALAIYGIGGKITETPHIGTSNRWLAPIGAADLDGDGHIEIAYVDRPHLAKTIRVWRFRNGNLEPVSDLPGFTNHRIGERDIAGGMRTCGGKTEMIVATANWANVVAIRMEGETFKARNMGPHKGRVSFAEAMAC
jgi:hypothetical protein